MKIGKLVQQKSEYKAFVPGEYPPKDDLIIDKTTPQLFTKATFTIEKLDGISQFFKRKSACNVWG